MAEQLFPIDSAGIGWRHSFSGEDATAFWHPPHAFARFSAAALTRAWVSYNSSPATGWPILTFFSLPPHHCERLPFPSEWSDHHGLWCGLCKRLPTRVATCLRGSILFYPHHVTSLAGKMGFSGNLRSGSSVLTRLRSVSGVNGF